MRKRGISHTDRLSREFAGTPRRIYRGFRRLSKKYDEIAAIMPLIKEYVTDGMGGTASAYRSGDENKIRKIRKGGFLLPGKPEFLRIYEGHGIREFLDKMEELRYHAEFWLHPPDKGKLKIGYEPEEVAITLVYATPGSRNNTYFVFTRNAESKIGVRLPKKVIKKLTPARDVVEAAAQGRENLSGLMESGDIGPFGLNDGDKVVIDAGSFWQSRRNPSLLVNFSGGRDHLSFNMRLEEFDPVLSHLYDKDVIIDVVDLWGTGEEF